MNKNKIIVWLLLVSLGLAVWLLANNKPKFWKRFQASELLPSCNTQIIKINGQLQTYLASSSQTSAGAVMSSDQAYYLIKKANDNPDIKVVVLELDSAGGSLVAAEEIARALQSVSKPSVVYIRDRAAGPAYLIASGAKRVFAANLSNLSLGLNTKIAKAKADQLEAVNINYQLVGLIGKNRKLDYRSLARLVNGTTYLGAEAKRLGLVDELGGLDEVRAYIKTDLLAGTEPQVCWQ